MSSVIRLPPPANPPPRVKSAVQKPKASTKPVPIDTDEFDDEDYGDVYTMPQKKKIHNVNEPVNFGGKAPKKQQQVVEEEEEEEEIVQPKSKSASKQPKKTAAKPKSKPVEIEDEEEEEEEVTANRSREKETCINSQN